MKKRHLVKRYGLAAAVLAFLLIWISQQTAVDNTVRYTAAVERRSSEYDPARWLGGDGQPLQQVDDGFRDTVRHRRGGLPGHGSERLRFSSRNSSGSTSVDSRTFPDTDRDATFVREERSRNSSAAGDLNEDRPRSPIADQATEPDSRRDNVDVRAKRFPVDDTNDSVRGRFRPTTAARDADSFTRSAPLTAHSAAEYRQTRIDDDSGANSGKEPSVAAAAHDLVVRIPGVQTSTTARSRRPARLSPDDDDDADASLILARQMSRKSFVIIDEKRPTSTDRPVDKAASSTVAAQSNPRHHYARPVREQ